MAKSKFIPKANLSRRDNNRLAKVHNRCMQLCRLKPKSAERYLAALQELTAITQTIVQMQQEAAHV